MAKQNFLKRFFGLFMLAWVLVSTIAPARVWAKPVVEKQADADKKDTQKTPVTVSEWQADVLVPSHAFTFDSQEFTWPSVILEIPVLVSEWPSFTKPVYRLSFFEKVFERLIAPNAP